MRTSVPTGTHEASGPLAPAADALIPLAYRPAEAARVLGVTRGYVHDLIAAGKLRARKAGVKCTLIERTELERYIASLPLAGGDAA